MESPLGTEFWSTIGAAVAAVGAFALGAIRFFGGGRGQVSTITPRDVADASAEATRREVGEALQTLARQRHDVIVGELATIKQNQAKILEGQDDTREIVRRQAREAIERADEIEDRLVRRIDQVMHRRAPGGAA